MILLVWTRGLLFLDTTAALILVNNVQELLTLTGCIITISGSVHHNSVQCKVMVVMGHQM